MNLTVPSYAKINWFLKVLGRRPDGYHEVLTVLQTVDLHDTLRFESTTGPAIEIHLTGRPVAEGEKNLIFQAAKLLRQAADIRRGVHVQLSKRIPPGAGLGGGSSNAAVTLVVLNQLWNCGLAARDLATLAGRLGTDVPFFLSGGTSLGFGRGERIRLFPEISRAVPLRIAFPGFEISTAEAYREAHFGEIPSDQLTTRVAETTIDRFHEVLRDEAWMSLENDFEGSVFPRFPILQEWKRRLVTSGCQTVKLCGSGSALFGIHRAHDRTQSELGPVAELGPEVFHCVTLTREKYRQQYRVLGIELPGETI